MEGPLDLISTPGLFALALGLDALLLACIACMHITHAQRHVSDAVTGLTAFYREDMHG